MASSSNGDPPPLQDIMLEFRAGKMLRQGTKVVPDPRKGLFRIARGEEGLLHFQWLDRTRNAVEDDQIIFPAEAVFEKVNQTSDRVYILKFITDDRKFFFWMQEPKMEEDSQICTSVNYYINQPLEFIDDERDASAPLQVSEDMIEDDISSRKMGKLDEVVGSRGGNLVGTNLGAEVISDVTSSGPVKLEDLQRILSGIQPVGDTMDDPNGGFGLGDILKPDLIMPLIGTLHLEQSLAPYLPEGQWSPEDILELLRSPPFRQQVDSFTYVLRTGQIDLSQFGIDPSKYKFTVLSFLEALEDAVSKASEVEDPRQDGQSLTSQSSRRLDDESLQ